MRRSMAPTTWSTMATTCHGLAPSFCESVSRLELTPISQVYSRRSIHDSECSPVRRLHGIVGGTSRFHSRRVNESNRLIVGQTAEIPTEDLHSSAAFSGVCKSAFSGMGCGGRGALPLHQQ